MTTTAIRTRKFDSLGRFVWWELSGTRITPAALRATLNAHGYAVDVPEIDPLVALKRACSSWSSGRLTTADSDKWKAEIVRTESHDAPPHGGGKVHEVYIGVLRRVRVSDRRVKWEQQELLRFSWTEGAPYSGTWDAPATTEQGREFQGEADELRTHHDHTFIRPKVLQPEIAKLAAVSVRSQGGIYYVPVQEEEGLSKLQQFVRQLGNSRLMVAQIGNDADSVESVAGATRDHIIGGVADVRERLAAWRESSRNVRADSAATTMAALGDLLTRAELYEEALDVSLEDLRDDIRDARRAALLLIAGEDAPEPAAEAAA